MRGEIIGALGTRGGGERRWSQDDISFIEAIAERMALAADNLRLLDETQRRVAQERLVGEVTGRMRESLDIEIVLQTAAREIGQALGLAALDVRLGGDVEHPVEDKA